VSSPYIASLDRLSLVRLVERLCVALLHLDGSVHTCNRRTTNITHSVSSRQWRRRLRNDVCVSATWLKQEDGCGARDADEHSTATVHRYTHRSSPSERQTPVEEHRLVLLKVSKRGLFDERTSQSEHRRVQPPSRTRMPPWPLRRWYTYPEPRRFGSWSAWRAPWTRLIV